MSHFRLTDRIDFDLLLLCIVTFILNQLLVLYNLNSVQSFFYKEN